MTHAIEASASGKNQYVLTHGGLVRTLKSGCPEQTMRLCWAGTLRAPGLQTNHNPQDAEPESSEFMVEIELLQVKGDKVTLRLWAPDEVRIMSAKKAAHLRAG